MRRRRGIGEAPGDEARWRKFIAITAGQPAWPSLVRAAGLFDKPGDALDVGAGAGRDTAYLLEHGWRVTAVDSSPSAAAALARLANPKLKVVVERVQDFVPAAYHLVNAQFSLPFIPPATFEGAVERLQGSLRPRGVMAATFFGVNDGWNVRGSNMTFSTRAGIERLFDGWKVVELTEEDDKHGHTADGSPKHWHVFHLIARAPR
jgi:tellurite methyltransferase